MGSDERHQELVLIVDDDESTRLLLSRILDQNGYNCISAASFDEARQHLAEESLALVLTDMNMPGGSGFDLLMSISNTRPDVATLLVTGVDDPKIAGTALEMGAYGYLTKPVRATEIMINVASAIARRRLEIENLGHRTRLEQMVKDRTQELVAYISHLEKAEQDVKTLQAETIKRLCLAAEFRDDDTPRHVQRVSRYCELIAGRVGEAADRCQLIGTAGSMHDVGKIGIPDSILLKPGPLAPDEWEIMKRHCDIGHRLLSGTNIEVLNTAGTIALTHHERVDGTGYPQGLRGEDIPIEGRIAAVADVFDALTSERPYSAAVSTEVAVGIMREGRGTHFDRVLLDAFLTDLKSVLEIKERWADPDPVEEFLGFAEHDPPA